MTDKTYVKTLETVCEALTIVSEKTEYSLVSGDCIEEKARIVKIIDLIKSLEKTK